MKERTCRGCNFLLIIFLSQNKNKEGQCLHYRDCKREKNLVDTWNVCVKHLFMECIQTGFDF